MLLCTAPVVPENIFVSTVGVNSSFPNRDLKFWRIKNDVGNRNKNNQGLSWTKLPRMDYQWMLNWKLHKKYKYFRIRRSYNWNLKQNIKHKWDLESLQANQCLIYFCKRFFCVKTWTEHFKHKHAHLLFKLKNYIYTYF